MAAPTPHWSLPLLDGTEPGVFKTLYNALANALEAALDAFKTAMGYGFLGPYSSLSALNAVTGDHAGQRATVAGSATTAENGDYRWSGTAWYRPYLAGNFSDSVTPSGTAGSISYSAPVSVSFPVAFPNAPHVTVADHGATAQWASVASVTATGFTFRVLNGASAPTTANTEWIAVAQ